MAINRRQFLSTAGAVAATSLASCSSQSGASPTLSDAASVREKFPRAVQQVYLDSAAHAPLGTHTRSGMEKYMDFHMYGGGEGRGEYASKATREVKAQFGRLINAKPSEIAFVQNTKAGEDIIVNGLDIQASGGNVVTNDQHYAGSIHSYVGRKKAGMDVRIIRAKDWVVDLNDMEAAIDSKTKLVAITLVSNVNGHIQEAKALAEIAHAKGAHVYADIIQAAGAIPMDVKALGIDFAACSNYKWLQGCRGSGFLYVREDLQGTVVRDLLFPGYVRFNYPPWVDAADAGEEAMPFTPPDDAGRYEAGNTAREGYCGQYESFKLMEEIGMGKIFAHNMALVDRIRKGLPESKYECITPAAARSPIIVFIPADYAGTEAKLKQANIQATMTGNRLRISPNIYNNQEDIDKLLNALA
ncbi:MAG TPA: aminotransferase class V-fold PLP-dependent enzyme [Bryobacterales bacterium]|nr:aminotransferase class V-fold PLP-dependent enzyme [Bryobacterales bacterium]